MSLDAGLRPDGSLALDLWDTVIELPGTTKDNVKLGHTSSGKLEQTQHHHICSGKRENVQPNWTICDSKTKTQHVNRKQGCEHLSEADHAPTNTRSSRGESQLYIFEDNEAVTKMIIKGRSPTMRHGYLIGQPGTQNPNQMC